MTDPTKNDDPTKIDEVPAPGCEEMRHLLSLRLDGEADSAQNGRVVEHLAACADCRATERLLLAVRQRLQGVAAAVTPIGMGARVVQAALENRIVRLGRRRFLVRAAAAAVLLAAGSGGMLVTHSPGPPQSGPLAERTKVAVIVPTLEQRR